MKSPREETESRLRQHVCRLYEIGDDSCTTRAWLDQAQLLRGFVDALKVTRAIEPHMIRKIIDETHIGIFGESRPVRKERTRVISDAQKVDNWDSLEIPAFIRRKSKKLEVQ